MNVLYFVVQGKFVKMGNYFQLIVICKPKFTLKEAFVNQVMPVVPLHFSPESPN